MSTGQAVKISVRGQPSPEELAVVVALLTRPRAAQPAAPPATSRWASRASLLRRPLSPGPGAWSAAAWGSR